MAEQEQNINMVKEYGETSNSSASKNTTFHSFDVSIYLKLIMFVTN